MTLSLMWWVTFMMAAVFADYSSGATCPPNICGEKAICEMRNGRAYCKCPEGHYGNPLYRCTPECEQDGHCSNDQFCEKFRCKSVCSPNVCVPGAQCSAAGHRPVCKCPPNYMGSPETRCYPECTEEPHCPSSKTCLNFRCMNPCESGCGRNAQCTVRNHRAICSCPRGMTGHPLELCRPITTEDVCNPSRCGTNADCKAENNTDGYLTALCSCPSGYYGNPLNECKKGNCIDSNDCPDDKACWRAQCVNPCQESGCGVNALCRVKAHRAYCSCPVGYHGNPFEQCYKTQRG